MYSYWTKRKKLNCNARPVSFESRARCGTWKSSRKNVTPKPVSHSQQTESRKKKKEKTRERMKKNTHQTSSELRVPDFYCRGHVRDETSLCQRRLRFEILPGPRSDPAFRLLAVWLCWLLLFFFYHHAMSHFGVDRESLSFSLWSHFITIKVQYI
jgi:hypothetical protein